MYIYCAQHYGSMMYAVIVCPCLSICHKPVLYQNDGTKQAGFFAWRLSCNYPTLYCKEIWVPHKVWAYKILPQPVDHVVTKICCQFSLLTMPTTVHVSWLFVDHNAVTP